MERGQFGARVEAELVREPAPQVRVRGEGLALPARQIQRPQLDGAEPLPERMARDEVRQLPGEEREVARLQERLGPFLPDGQPLLRQTLRSSTYELLVREIRVGRTTPQLQCLGEAFGPFARTRRGSRPVHQGQEALGVHLVPGLVETEPVAGSLAHHAVAAERLAQLRDLRLEGVGGIPRKIVAPQAVDETVGGDGPPLVDQERGEEGPDLHLGNHDRIPVAVPHRQWTKHPEPHASTVHTPWPPTVSGPSAFPKPRPALSTHDRNRVHQNRADPHTTRHAHQAAPSTAFATENRKLPLPALLALATAVFVTSLTETLPAGLLPAMSRDLGVGESATGQTVTVYAIGTALTAIPLTAATAGWRRKRLLTTAMAGFGVANTVTALSTNFPLTMVARFVAGVAAGLAWALLAGYARRLAPAHLQGRAIAIAMAGIPVALSLGVPAGTFLGKAVNWQIAFVSMTVLTVALLGWIAAAVPDQPGLRQGARPPMLRALRVPGVPRSSSSPSSSSSPTPSSIRTSPRSSTESAWGTPPISCCSSSAPRPWRASGSWAQ